MTRALLVIRELFLSRGAYARQYFTRVQPCQHKKTDVGQNFVG